MEKKSARNDKKKAKVSVKHLQEEVFKHFHPKCKEKDENVIKIFPEA